jgi:hypothetical protein
MLDRRAAWRKVGHSLAVIRRFWRKNKRRLGQAWRKCETNSYGEYVSPPLGDTPLDAMERENVQARFGIHQVKWTT